MTLGNMIVLETLKTVPLSGIRSASPTRMTRKPPI